MIWLLRKLRQLFGRPTPALTATADTEAAAEVVRVTALEPHGNADKLEMARFEMAGTGPSAYEVVVQKGQFQVGDLAGYFSVDCVVPIKGPFAFLGKRLDGVGKTHYRLKAARLRGRYSQGLLVAMNDRDGEWPPGVYALGTKLWDTFGVTYHRPPEPGEPSLPNSSSKRFVPQPLPVYEVTSLKKVPNLFEGCPTVFVTEKIHGTNFRFGWVRRRLLGVPYGWRFVVGSHRVIKTDGTGNHYYGDDLWSEAARRMALATKTADYKGYKFFGELYGYTYSGQAIQDLTYGRSPTMGPGLAMFDVQGPNGWLEPNERYELCRSLGLPCVPVVQAASWTGSVDMLAEGQSLVCPSQIREGVVVESVGVAPRLKAKYVGQGYLLRKEA